jgi:hypothetical protein
MGRDLFSGFRPHTSGSLSVGTGSPSVAASIMRRVQADLRKECSLQFEWPANMGLREEQ